MTVWMPWSGLLQAFSCHSRSSFLLALAGLAGIVGAARLRLRG
ncbi:hypothetical protein [Microlunatus endophyticus]|nr:hypothetical protein [Microlunatus endophyticus]